MQAIFHQNYDLAFSGLERQRDELLSSHINFFYIKMSAWAIEQCTRKEQRGYRKLLENKPSVSCIEENILFIWNIYFFVFVIINSKIKHTHIKFVFKVTTKKGYFDFTQAQQQDFYFI